MIVYVFNERIYYSQSLSSKLGGMYPIYIDGIIAANIIANNNSWMIKLSDRFSSKEIYFEEPRLEPYKIYTITSKLSGEKFRLIATPRFNSDIRSYDIIGQVTIGSDRNCDIFYPLEDSKNEYLRIFSSKQGWIAETNSPYFFVSGERVKNGQKIFCGDYIFYNGLKLIFMDSRILVDSSPSNFEKVRINRLTESKSLDTQRLASTAENNGIREELPLYTEKDYYFKSPRFNYVIEPAEVEIDTPPEPYREGDIPAIITLGPQLTMAGASVISMMGLIIPVATGNSNNSMIGVSIGVMSFTLAGTLLWPIITRKYNKHRMRKKEEKRQKKYLKYLSQKQNLINFIKANQRQTLLENNPAPVGCMNIIINREKTLWQREAIHDDFLKVRLGVGQVPTKIKIEKPKETFSVEDDDNLFLAMKKTVDDSLNIENAPIVYDLTERSIDAVVGDADSIKNFMDCFLLQALTFHSYVDLKLIVFTKEPRKWEYLRIVPHCFDNQKNTRYFATSVEKLSIISTELEKVFDARAANDEEVQLEDDGEKPESQSDFKSFRPYYLFFIDDMSMVHNVSLINKILRYKRNLGFSIITTSQDTSSLPNETVNFIYVSRQGSAIITGDNNNKKESFVADFNDGLIDMDLCARLLANIPIQVESEKFELPSSISFLELYKDGRVEQLNSLARWSNNDPSLSLSVPIGIDQNSEILQMDIHEKAYGPHGLIAGTTGSGKSEWIITFVLSLSVNFNPDEVQFVLIDYKGGGLAKSFENSELGIKLPHLAGTITNLDKSEIFRSIAAIESELKRRQAIFNAAREKLKEGSMDIYKYQRYYRKGLLDEPMSHLLIICDEFAELKQQEPDFMDQLISTSRIGRSLGVHLILATQKPSGVVNDQIWSNSRFKVCLKVQDRSDSNEVLKKPDAAFLKQTGSFYLQVGNNDYYNLGQVAWAGAKYYPSDMVEHRIDNSVACINDIGQVVGTFKEPEKIRENKGEELLNIVSYVSNLAKQIELKGRPLWLDNIPSIIYLSDLNQKYHVQPSSKYTYNTIIGEYDEPREQKQGLLQIDLAAGNVAVIGRADSSIEKLLSAIIWSSICERTPAEIAYYIIDFGSETMKKFAKFPQVGEVVFQDEIDKITGLLGLITDELDRRKDILSNYNGSFEYYNKVEKEKMNLMVVIINNYDVFGETLPRSIDLMNELFRDAPKYGIIFIITSNTNNAISSRTLQFFNHVILMQMSDDSQYRSITNCRRGLIPKKVIGRGICMTDSTNENSYCEFQTALIAPEEEELDVIQSYANKCVDYYKCKVKQLTKIPEDVSSDDLNKYVTDLSNVPIGLDLYEKRIANYDFLKQKIHLFTGKDITKNMNFIYGLASILSKVQNTKVRVIGGIEIFKNLFNHVKNSKKSIYILIDDYDYLKAIKLEDWFNDIDISNGLWMGADLSSQNLLDCEPVRSEDKKFDFPGLGFEISDKKYKVIKALSDGEE